MADKLKMNTTSMARVGFTAAVLACFVIGCGDGKEPRQADCRQVRVLGTDVVIYGEESIAFMPSPSGKAFLSVYMLEGGDGMLLAHMDAASEEVTLKEITSGLFAPRWLGPDVVGLFARDDGESFAVRIPSFERQTLAHPNGARLMAVDADRSIYCMLTEDNDALVIDYRQGEQTAIAADQHGLDGIYSIDIVDDRLLITGTRDDEIWFVHTQLWSIQDVARIREFRSEKRFPPGWGTAARQIGPESFCWPVRPGVWELADLADGRSLCRFGVPAPTDAGSVRPSRPISEPDMIRDLGMFVEVRKTASLPEATIALVDVGTGEVAGSFEVPLLRLDDIYVTKAGDRWLLLSVTTRETSDSHYWQAYELPDMRAVGEEVELPWASRHHRRVRDGVLWLAVGRDILRYDFATEE